MNNIFDNLRPSLIKILRYVEHAQGRMLTLEKNENNKYLFENAFITGNMTGEEITNVVLTDKGFDALDYYYTKTSTNRRERQRFWTPIIISIIALVITVWFNLDKVISQILLLLDLLKNLL